MIQLMKSVFGIFILSAFLFSCEKDDADNNGTESDLSSSEQQLLGTWRHVETEGGISPGPVDYGVFEWTFNADRSGEYYQNPDNAEESTNDFFWKVEGDDIIFTDSPGGEGDRQYRIDESGENRMEWFNYTLEDTYIVEKQ
ncbi:MAG: lipocalin family protein [Chitinophagales bacterium]